MSSTRFVPRHWLPAFFSIVAASAMLARKMLRLQTKPAFPPFTVPVHVIASILVRPSTASALAEKKADRNSGKCAPATLTKHNRLISMRERRSGSLGILVHGCHLEADGWEEIVWGEPPDQMGRLPHALKLAWQEQDTLRSIVCGTGASESSDGRLEGQYTVDFLWAHFDELKAFSDFSHVPLEKLRRLVEAHLVVETKSQNTVEEVREAFAIFERAKCDRAVLVSSPTHLPRCLACACRVAEAEPDSFSGSIWASPSDTSYSQFSAADVVVVEPPHRGDRDKSLDTLPFHDMVRRFYCIPNQDKARFLNQFEQLLQSYGV